MYTGTLAIPHMLDNIIIVIYFVVVFGIGLYHSRRQKTAQEYFLAGHSVGWFAVGASLFSSPSRIFANRLGYNRVPVIVAVL